MVGMLLGGTKHGAVSTQLAAEEQVHDAFAAEGIDFAVEAPRKALQWCRRLERDAVKGRPMPALAREALDLFHVVEKTARNHLNQTGDWPLEHRAAWLAQVAYGVRTRAM